MLKIIPFVSCAQLREIDSRSSKEFGVSGEELMENAGKRVAEFALEIFGAEEKFVVLCGKGNNAGDGLVAARLLKEAGAEVRVILAENQGLLSGLAQKKFLQVKDAGISFEVFSGSKDLLRGGEKVVIDAMLGYGLKGHPRGKCAELICEANSARRKGARIVAVDVPSGLESDSGKACKPCIRADFTICFGLPKTGFTEKARELTGRVFLADIGFPEEIYKGLHTRREFVFGKSGIVELGTL